MAWCKTARTIIYFKTPVEKTERHTHPHSQNVLGRKENNTIQESWFQIKLLIKDIFKIIINPSVIQTIRAQCLHNIWPRGLLTEEKALAVWDLWYASYYALVHQLWTQQMAIGIQLLNVKTRVIYQYIPLITSGISTPAVGEVMFKIRWAYALV